MNYKEYEIEEDNTGFAPEKFSFFLDDGERYIGSGNTIEECKSKIDIEEIVNNIQPLIINWLKSEDENATNLAYQIAEKIKLT